MTNRLALATTLVSGSITLQGKVFTFTASASGTGIADQEPEAKTAAIIASNTAATTAARASIDKILADNSAVLSDLEITSLISNNFSTTVVVFKPIALDTIATSSDGVNYTVKPNTTIGSGQWLTVPNGKTLSFDFPSTSYGYIQIGDIPIKSGLRATYSTQDEALAVYNSPFTNYGTLVVYHTCNIESGFTNDTGGCLIIDVPGTCNIQGGAPYGAEPSHVDNIGVGSYVRNFGIINLLADHKINNLGDNSFVHNETTGTIYQNGNINCDLYGVPTPGAYAINDGISKNVFCDCPLWVRTPPV
jgi:hypothetical protein